MRRHPVHLKCPRLAEPLPTLLADERLLLGVGVLVVAQMVLPPEGLLADLAWVGPLVGVGALVDEQVVGLGELSTAVPADELLFGAAASTGAQHG